MIVDDGSTDGTQELVRSWIERGEIAIDYVKTVNGGKPRAINLGVSRCDSPLFFVVDSDDWLLPGAIEHVLAVWATIAGNGLVKVNVRFADEDVWLTQGQLAEIRSEEHTSELQSRRDLVCRLLLEKKKIIFG